MKEEKRKKVKAAGWEIGEADDFLELPPEGVKFREEGSNKDPREAFLEVLSRVPSRPPLQGDELPDELERDEESS